jgi:arylsulfatase A
MKKLLAMACAWQLAGAVAQAAPPNFVVINIDDLGYADIGAFGSKINRTPHLDRMGREGRKLTSFYAAPVCSPSRAALMTGCYAKRALPIPHVLFPVGATGLAPEEVTVAEVLKEKGYATAIIGKWHLGDQPEFLPNKQGFDYYFGLPYSNDMGPVGDGVRSDLGKPLPQTKGKGQPPLALLRNGQVVKRVLPDDQQSLVELYTDEAVKFIREKKDAPFFLYLPHNSVHFPIYPGKKWAGKSPHGIYSDWVEETDWSVGRVLDALRENKLDKNTLVIFTSDNGGTARGSNAPLRGLKGSTWEGGMRAATIAWWPGKIPANTQSDAIASMFDILPTFAALAEAKLPQNRKLDGANIWPQLSGEAGAKAAHDAFYYFQGLKLNAVREGDWKLTITGEKPVLYNLRDDIGEEKDVAKDNPEVVARLQKLVDAQKDDLGLDGVGPGCRALGRVENPKPLIPFDETPEAAPVSLDKLKIGDTLPGNEAPQVGKAPLTISCTVESADKDAVIVAQGGLAVGYALTLKEGRVAWLVRTSRENLTTVTAPHALAGQLQVEARLLADKTMTLHINGQKVAEGKAAALLPNQPAEEFCVGFDSKMTVGDYDGSKRLNGTISNLKVNP